MKSKNKFCKILALVLAGVLLCGLPAAVAYGAGAKPEPSMEFTRLNDVPAAFDKLSPQGVKYATPSNKGFPEEIIKVNSNHIQGMAKYGKYTIISVMVESPWRGIISAYPAARIISTI